MKLFLKKSFLLLLYVFAVIAFLGFCYYAFMAPQYQYSYAASFQDKIYRLKNLSEPKIILVGNSNLAFGIDSEILEREFNRPVVNLGLHGGLGNAFHEEMAKFNIGKGDLIIICHSSYSDDDKISDPELALVTVDNFYEGWKIFRCKDILQVLKVLPRFILKGCFLWATGLGNRKRGDCYTRLGFNGNGDLIYQREYDKSLFGDIKSGRPEINEICTDRINHFNSYCTARGATLLIAGYPILERDGQPSDSAYYKDFSSRLQEKVDCKVVSDFSDYIFCEKYFYNTVLHLTNEGAKKRTEQLVSDLREAGF